MEEYSLSQTIDSLLGPPKEQIVTHNYWAATGLDRYHNESKAEFECIYRLKTIPKFS